MDEKEVPTYIEDLIEQVCKENEFVNYTVKVEPNSQAGDGFTSELLSVNISENGSEKQLNVVCKMAPLNKNRQTQFFSDMTFEREITFYQKVMPCFAQFQEEKLLPKEDQFLSYPKCYGAVVDNENSNFALILEDLRPSGFRLWNKAKVAQIENLELGMRELGKFHGISIAMKDQQPEKFAEFTEIHDLMTVVLQRENFQAMYETSYDRTIAMLSNEHHKNIMRDVKTNIHTYLNSCLSEEASSRFGVVCHGDFWNNNILYKFNENNEIAEDIRLLDWAVIRYASPATDLVFNLFPSTDKALRDENYDNLIEIYYKSLSKTVRLLGSNPDELFTFDDLQNELKMCGIFALVTAPMILQVSQADTSDITNLDNACDENDAGEDNYELITSLNDEAQRKCEQLLHDIIEDIVARGYYPLGN